MLDKELSKLFEENDNQMNSSNTKVLNITNPSFGKSCYSSKDNSVSLNLSNLSIKPVKLYSRNSNGSNIKFRNQPFLLNSPFKRLIHLEYPYKSPIKFTNSIYKNKNYYNKNIKIVNSRKGTSLIQDDERGNNKFQRFTPFRKNNKTALINLKANKSIQVTPYQTQSRFHLKSQIPNYNTTEILSNILSNELFNSITNKKSVLFSGRVSEWSPINTDLYSIYLNNYNSTQNKTNPLDNSINPKMSKYLKQNEICKYDNYAENFSKNFEIFYYSSKKIGKFSNQMESDLKNSPNNYYKNEKINKIIHKQLNQQKKTAYINLLSRHKRNLNLLPSPITIQTDVNKLNFSANERTCKNRNATVKIQQASKHRNISMFSPNSKREKSFLEYMNELAREKLGPKEKEKREKEYLKQLIYQITSKKLFK